MEQSESGEVYPEGIGEQHTRPRSAWHQHHAWIALVVLAALIAAALSGVLGGHRNPTRTSESARADLTVNVPAILRSGEFFEMRFRIDARQPISKPVLAVSHAYLRDLTLNTFKPSPAGETSDGSFYRLELEPMAAGDTFELMIDGQVNPDLFLGTRGMVQLLDDETPIVAMPLELEVRP